ncbi:protein-tyrosine sulfotransferase isoform X3 [Punica granatum]|uniref:Protein-tyrosine sulfotransferase isoform X3 n=1 Tax=Punica granatum TaxID=22663 RepID=A0A6P8CMB8_PUNGR|nr:protein-tyrosine sulfotransferase isoform X3 [Punica granatum]
MGLMVSTLLKLAALLILLGLTNASPDKFNFGHCEKIVKRWASSAVNQEAKADAHTLRDLLFFLHVPRTGGRTYFHCFLKKLYSNSQECPRSYDKLRFDPSKAKCRLLVNHDDYSMMSKLPDERTSVVTILRNPVDRVFSTYEFSVERDARRRNGPIEVEGNDPYDMEEMVMPLHDYINDPIARDIIHNGATFQVAGLTNNSYFTDAHEVRHCIMQYKELGDYALAVAKKRLDNMLYVGLTEEHRESATMFANVVGAQVISQLKSTKPGAATAAAEETSEQSTILDPEPDDGQSQNTTSEQENGISTPGNAETGKGNMTVNKLMGAYESCISTLRKSQSRRRVTSLKHIAPANFTKEARLHVSAAVLREIKSLNSLDLELYEYAQEIFAKQHSLSNQKLLTTESFGGIISSSYSITPWNLVLLASPLILLVLFIFAFVRARRTSKIKI